MVVITFRLLPCTYFHYLHIIFDNSFSYVNGKVWVYGYWYSSDLSINCTYYASSIKQVPCDALIKTHYILGRYYTTIHSVFAILSSKIKNPLDNLCAFIAYTISNKILPFIVINVTVIIVGKRNSNAKIKIYIDNSPKHDLFLLRKKYIRFRII